MATPTAARPELDAAAGLPIFQEVLQSLLHEGSHEETLTLISRRVTELAAFDFCGIVLPDADWTHVRLAASHGFPPRYASRLSDTFLAPLDGTPLAGSPTAMAMRLRRAVGRVLPAVARARARVRLPVARVCAAGGAGRGARGAERVRASAARAVRG